MNILITGGCGFIGTNFILYILNKYSDYKIVNLDVLTYASNKHFHSKLNNKNYKFIQGNILDNKLVFSLIKEADVCINFAAESHVDNSITNPEPFITTNINGTFTLLENARKAKLKKYIQISTDEVYGSLEKSVKSTENFPLNPSSPYSSSKASADLLVLAYYKTYSLPTIITRCSNNYGPFQHSEKLIPLFIKNLLHDIKTPLYGDGLNIRDWVYVEDHCLGIDLVLHKGKFGEIYNISSNCEKSNIEITKILIEKLGKSYELIDYISDRLGHDRRYSLDNNKIVKELGFVPQFSFEDGINNTINWYKKIYNKS